MIWNKIRPLYKKILIGVFLLLLAAGGVIWYIFNEKFTDTAERKADYTVNAIDFIREFQKNDSLANAKYIEKIVTVNGVVSKIEPVSDTVVNIKMADAATGDYIIFAFQQEHAAEAKQLKEGGQASVKGSCSGGTYSEILETRYISFKRSALNK